MKSIIIAIIIVVLSSGSCLQASMSSYDFPGAVNTAFNDIDGSNIVGTYYDGSAHHGFFYDGVTWQTKDFQGATRTDIRGIDGSNIVGYYAHSDGVGHGFLNGDTIDVGTKPTIVCGIDGNNLVGYYDDADGAHGFFYDGADFTPVNFPGATITAANGIYGSKIVGTYYDSLNKYHGFIYDRDGKNFTSFDVPGATNTCIYDIYGSYYVGYYRDGGISDSYHGFIYDGVGLTTIDFPGSNHTELNGTDGFKHVGTYIDNDGHYHGFVVSEPDPVQEILAFIEQSVADGTLVPVKPGKPGEGQLGALINMIKAAGELIKAEDTLGACGQLHAALGKTDSQEQPPDFVTGEATAELAGKIQELMTILGCE